MKILLLFVNLTIPLLSIFSLKFLNFLFSKSIDASLSTHINLTGPYQIASIMGSMGMIFIFYKSQKITEPRMRTLRRVLFGMLSLITLLSFSMLSFSSYRVGNNSNDSSYIPYIDESNSIHLATFSICAEICLFAAIILLERLFRPDQSTDENSNTLDEEDKDSKTENDISSERAEKIVNISKAILITFIISIVPFIMDLFFNFSVTEKKPLGRIVGINDLYLIPAAFGAVEASLHVSSNEELKNRHVHPVKRLVITTIGLVSLISFSLFAFGCNQDVNDVMNEPYSYAIAGSLSFAIAFLTIFLNYLGLREISNE